jgi:hypothetical protein
VTSRQHAARQRAVKRAALETGRHKSVPNQPPYEHAPEDLLCQFVMALTVGLTPIQQNKHFFLLWGRHETKFKFSFDFIENYTYIIYILIVFTDVVFEEK